MSELAYLGWLDAAAAIRRGELSPVEYLGELVERIERYDPGLDAFVLRTFDAALAAAREAERAVAAGAALGPLHGVPFGLKDIIDAAGLPTTAHSAILRENVAPGDAEVTRRLRGAGGILIGKLATHEFAIGGPCFDLPWPPARNPWDRRMFPGGSSSGSGAAVAAGFLPLALGSDTGGSVRNPASMCGIVGMKATYGRVSRRGVVPLSFSLDHVGPLTRTVAENAAALGIIAGHDPADPASAAVAVPDYAAAARAGVEGGLAGVRVGVLRHFYREDMVADPAVDAGIESAVTALETLGAEVRELRTLALDEFAAANRTILLSEAYAIHQEWLQDRPQDYGAITRARILPGAFIRAVDYVQAVRRRRELTAEIDRVLHEVDVLVTASSMDPPFPIEDPDANARLYPRQARSPFNATGHPALAIPVGFTAQAPGSPALPLSMQIVARHWDEASAYRVAAAYEAAAGPRDRHPPLDG